MEALLEATALKENAHNRVTLPNFHAISLKGGSNK